MSRIQQPFLPLTRPGLRVPPALRAKCLRVNFGAQLRMVDLFSGCGGWSCGFESVGGADPAYLSVAAVEKNPVARRSHERNFGGGRRSYKALGDITEVTPTDLTGHLQEPLAQCVDVIVGSPPCQPFSRVGRAKLRSLAEEQSLEAVYGDRRVGLVEHYLRLVEALQPLAFAIENVTDYTRFKHRNVAEEVALAAEDMGYRCRYTLLNAVWFGVPQLRERVVILGIHESLRADPVFPTPSHRCDIPEGYVTSRADRESLGNQVLEPNDHFFQVRPSIEAQPAVSTKEALADLPIRGGYRGGRFEPERLQTYSRGPGNTYQRLMRSWPGFAGREDNQVAEHRTRTLLRDYGTFARMKAGARYEAAHAIAMERYTEALQIEESTLGRSLTKDEKDALRASIVPPYPLDKFRDKWQKLDEGKPSHTLPAHLAHDCYSHIHYDSEQARTITIREAARLQSFPDGFHFEGGMNDSYRQIGNAVPPLMARAVAKTLLETLQAAVNRQMKGD